MLQTSPQYLQNMAMKRSFFFLKCCSILFGLALTPAKAPAQVALDNFARGACGVGVTGDTACTGSGKTLSYSLTVGTGINRALVVFVSYADNNCSGTPPALSSVTYAGVSLTQVGSTYSQPTCTQSKLSIWQLPAGTQPSSGANNIVVTMATAITTGSLHSGAFAMTGVDQNTTFSASVTNGSTGNSSPATATLGASGALDSVAIYACSGTNMNASTQNQKWQVNVTTQNGCDNDGGANPAGGTTAISWPLSSNDWWLVGAVAFKAAKIKHKVIQN